MYTQIIIKKFLLFFFIVYKNERKEHKFWQQKYQKSDFYNKNKKIFNIDNIDVNEILVSKKNNMVKIIHWNTLLGIMIMMLLDHCIYLFHYINKFDKNKITMSLMIKDIL